MAQSVQCMSLSISPGQTAAWHQQILEQLGQRSKREMENFRHYEQAVEQVHTAGVSNGHWPSGQWPLLCSNIYTSMSTLKRSTLSRTQTKCADFQMSVSFQIE